MLLGFEMSEAAWLEGKHPGPLLHHVRDRVGRRQCVLFACACHRRIWDRLPAVIRSAVEAAERYADGEADDEELLAAVGAALRASGGSDRNSRVWLDEPIHVVLMAAEAAVLVLAPPLPSGQNAERAEQARLLRCVVGNPFRPLPPGPFPAEVTALARACAAGDGAVYPILADALDELGAAHAAAHCREPLHARGCHVLDRILGKA